MATAFKVWAQSQPGKIMLTYCKHLLFILITGSILPAASLHAQTDPLAKVFGQNMTAWELIIAGGWVMVPLALASVIVVALAIYCLTTLREKNITDEELNRRIDAFLENEDFQGLAGYVAGRPLALANILDQVLKFLYRHPEASAEAVQAVAETAGSRIASSLNQRALYLLDIGAIAPMLGLAGTVIGIMKSFGHISAEQASPMRTLFLAGGVSQALIATATGLAVAITAMFLYSFLRGRVQHLVSILETHTVLVVQEIMLIKKRRQNK